MTSNLSIDTSQQRSEQRIGGIDSLRFILALWVVFGHYGFIPIPFDESQTAGKIMAGIYNNLFSGPAAVIVFFVISGFCIHYPFRHQKQLLLVPYFSRRHLRIWIPIGAAILLAGPLKVKLTMFQDSILWSLLAEEIYYLLYPGLLFLKRRIGWTPILSASYLGAFLVILSNPTASNYPSFGPYLNWVLGLPCWLLGCCLAQRADGLCARASGSEIHIWRWRFAALFLSALCRALRFHSPLKYPWTLTFFAVFAFFWLAQEIIYFQKHTPYPWLERAGKSSYSLYLTHKLAPPLYALFFLPLSSPLPHWIVQTAWTLLLCAVFYSLVERPSHSLARWVAAKLAPRPQSAVL